MTELLSEENLIIPEYRIMLLNKSKKNINTIENVKNITEFKKVLISKKKEKKKDTKLKKEAKKNKSKKVLRTLWVRRKKKLK